MTEHQPILVVGAGSWGTALAIVLARNGYTVWLWSRTQAHVAEMMNSGLNARFLPNCPFPKTLQPIAHLEEVVSQVQNIIVAVPSHGFRETLRRLAPYLAKTTRLCWVTKGLEPQSGLLLHQVAEQLLGKQRLLAVLSGPSFAAEVATGLPTAVTVASGSNDYAQQLVKLFHNQHFRLYTSADLIGVEVGGAVKNIIAIAAGIADGLNLGANTRAALITRGLTEMVRFGTALGGQRETFMGLAGLGDLVLTCTDNQSRNRRFGYALARGSDSQRAQTEIGQVVEGVRTTREVKRVAQQLRIEMPIVEQVDNVLQGICTPQEAANALLSREPKQENL
jgi:glycerol-3-phosphate dehydrogenase (NAD(P)+)